MALPVLPEGYLARTPDATDAPVAQSVVSACEAASLGSAQVDLEDIIADWRRPGYDVQRDGVLVLAPDGEPAAYAEVFRSRAEGSVLPNHRGRGIGAWLAAWITGRAREQGSRFVRQVVAAVELDSLELLREAGYERSDTAWELSLELAERQARPAAPRGVLLRDFVPGVDDEAAFRVIEDAFAPWPNREPNTLDGWRALTVLRSGFEPRMLPMFERDGEVVAAAYLIDYPDDRAGWVQQLAVREDQRGHGLGIQLLHEAFDRYARLGRTRVGLSTDSRTGALGLYQRVGMSVVREFAGHSLSLD